MHQSCGAVKGSVVTACKRLTSHRPQNGFISTTARSKMDDKKRPPKRSRGRKYGEHARPCRESVSRLDTDAIIDFIVGEGVHEQLAIVPKQPLRDLIALEVVRLCDVAVIIRRHLRAPTY